MRKLFSAGFTNGAVHLSMLVLRLVFGGLILLHGWPKLIHFDAKKNSFPDPLHVGHTLSLGITIFAEVACAIFLMLGLLTRIASVPLIICMAVIIFVIHANEPIDKIELPIMYLAAFCTILFIGPGKVSIDNLIA
ncbi:MAG: DoxX family protein [Chitinophaga sp.]|uniref:DoxX family protein n=1 Tax=Chitinophaga sp. TaxID=1869181 RepID=UPI0025BD22A1|nr:DoxX family protein [Chitinophaga sp.]MBV8253252.1 DoxX family protein [Chitinophaga sp.]